MIDRTQDRAVAVGEASSPELAIMERPAQCRRPSNIYMADSDFCRHCGTKRDAFDDFREFCTEIISAASENLCNYYEREIQHLTTDLVTCRTQLGRCAELLGQQLAKEQTYRDIIDKLSESSMRVLQNVSSPPTVDDAVKRQLHQMLEAMHQQSSSSWQDEIGQLHAHKELTENHLMTSAELQNQAEAVRKELENILALLKDRCKHVPCARGEGYTISFHHVLPKVLGCAAASSAAIELWPVLGRRLWNESMDGMRSPSRPAKAKLPLAGGHSARCGSSRANESEFCDAAWSSNVGWLASLDWSEASHAIEPGLTLIDFALEVEMLQESDNPPGTEHSLRGGSMSRGAGSLLDEHIDPDYQPSEKVEEYAEWLGMDLEKDRDLFWIARAGLKAPLPAPWKPCESEDGEIFYFNFETGPRWSQPNCSFIALHLYACNLYRVTKASLFRSLQEVSFST
ncbi:Cep164 [Symbiodinium sp. CCMP2456]|nr:Cep164 [Symbiodinium sp. CCMP2456]